MPNWVAYVFEAKGIQSYITAGGRLRDLAGGSALVEALCAERLGVDDAAAEAEPWHLPAAGLLDDTLAACGVVAPAFSKRAAGAFTLVAETPDPSAIPPLEDFARLWPLVVARAAPALESVAALGLGDDARAAVTESMDALQAQRSRRTLRLPLAPPLAARAPRTGMPAAGIDRGDVEAGAARGAVDHATQRKRRFPSDSPALARRVLPEHHPGRTSRTGLWPTLIVDRGDADVSSIDDRRRTDPPVVFPFPSDERRTIAVVHADANRMGLAFRRLGNSPELKADSYVESMKRLSALVQRVAEGAIQEAVAAHLMDPGAMPARPILAGGDDISFILRGDKALPFVETLLRAFKDRAAEIERYLEKEGIEDRPPRATLTAGVAFVGPSQPFSAAHRLAEELCKFAKKRAKALVADTQSVPSTIAFHRATASALSSWDDILKGDLTLAGGRRLTLAPYCTDREQAFNGLPSYQALRRLCDVLESPEFARGTARELISILALSPESARRRYARWRAVLRDQPDGLANFDEAMRSLGVEDSSDLFTSEHGGTPLADAVSLIAAERGRVVAGPA